MRSADSRICDGDPQAPAQNDAPGVGVLFGERSDVPDLCTPERVDRLIGVSGRGEIAVGQSHETGDFGLDGGSVLILVDEHVSELGRQFLPLRALE